MLEHFTKQDAIHFSKKVRSFSPTNFISIKGEFQECLQAEAPARIPQKNIDLVVYRSYQEFSIDDKPDGVVLLPVSLGLSAKPRDDATAGDWTININYSYELRGGLAFPKLLSPAVLSNGYLSMIPAGIISPDYLAIAQGKQIPESLESLHSHTIGDLQTHFHVQSPDATFLDAGHIFPGISVGRYNLANPKEALKALRAISLKHYASKNDIGALLSRKPTHFISSLFETADHRYLDIDYGKNYEDEIPLSLCVSPYSSDDLFYAAFKDVLGDRTLYLPKDQATMRIFSRVGSHRSEKERRKQKRLEANLVSMDLNGRAFQEYVDLTDRLDVMVTAPFERLDLHARGRPDFLCRLEKNQGDLIVTGVSGYVDGSSMAQALKMKSYRRGSNDKNMLRRSFDKEDAHFRNDLVNNLKFGMNWKPALALLLGELRGISREIDSWASDEADDELSALDLEPREDDQF